MPDSKNDFKVTRTGLAIVSTLGSFNLLECSPDSWILSALMDKFLRVDFSVSYRREALKLGKFGAFP